MKITQTTMKTKAEGYALLEVVVSIVIIVTVLAAAVGLLWSVSDANARNRDRLTALYLAQECVETSRNLRDTAWRQHLPWDCAFDENVFVLGCEDLKEEFEALENYGQLLEIDGTQTKFTRTTAVETIGEAAENQKIKITCTVSWPLKVGTDAVSLSHLLTDWRKK